MSNGSPAPVAGQGKPKVPVKIVFVGDTGVGKTSFIYRFMNDHPLAYATVSIGLEFACRDVRMPNGELVKAQLWDTAGVKALRAIARPFYRNAAGAVLLYDVTDASTFRSIVEYWLPALREYGREDCVLMLVGNKIDLTDESPTKRGVSTEEAQEFADSNRILFLETSARTGYKVDDAVMQLLEEACEKLKVAEKSKQAVDDVIRIDNTRPLEGKPKAGSCGC